MINKGFTLVELLVVIVIIAILATIAIYNFMSAQLRTKVARAKSEITSIAAALEIYNVDYGNYPLARTYNLGIKLTF